MATLKTQIQLRRDTAANLANVVLKPGEPGYATDTKKLAIGDGSTKFSSLKDYGALSDLSGYVTLGTAQTITGAKTFDNHIYFTNVGNSSANSKQIVWGNNTTKYGYITASTANQFGFGVNNTTIVLIGENYIGPNTSLDNNADLGRSNGAWRNLYIKNKIINGSNEYSLPNKTGTIALTNDIPTVSGFVTGPSSSTDNAIARYDGTTGKIIQNSRATIDDTGNLKINNSSGGDIGLILGRGSNADWRLLGKDGNFYIQGNYTTSKQTSFYDVLTLAYNSGNATVKGSVTANGFKHSNSTTGTNNYILLAGGGTKAISDFASADIGDDYLPLAGGTMTGAIARNYTSASTDPVLKIGSNNFDINIFKVYSSDNTYKATGVYGYNLTYNGTGSGVANTLTMYCDNQNASTQVIGWQLNQAGQMGIGTSASTSYRLTVNGSANATTLYQNGTKLDSLYAKLNHAGTTATYGLGTTTNYGHVKISNGDVNGVAHSDGVAAGMDHSHSNYALASDIPSVSGFVTGPSSSTDNAIARYDGKTGKVIQNSNATLDDSGNITLNGNIYGPQKGSNPRNIYGSNFYFFNCNASTTSDYNFGLYQWNDVFQFTTRTSSDNVYKTTAFEIEGSDGTTVFKKAIQTPGVVHSTLSPASGKTKDSYVLLAGGGTKAISDFQTSGNYVTLDTTQTITGAKTFSNKLVVTNTSAPSTIKGSNKDGYANQCAVSVAGGVHVLGPLIAAGGIYMDETSGEDTSPDYLLGVSSYGTEGKIYYTRKAYVSVGEADRVDGFDINAYGYKYQSSASISLVRANLVNADAPIYVKMTTNNPYHSQHIRFKVMGGYDNVAGSTEVTAYCRATNEFYFDSVYYNGNKLIGVYQPSANTNIYYLKFSKFDGTYASNPNTGTISVYAQVPGITLTLVQEGHADYAAMSSAAYVAVPNKGIYGSHLWNDMYPVANDSYNLGSSGYKWKTIHGTTLYENGTSLTDKYALKTEIPSVGEFVSGPSESTDNAVVRFDGTTGKLIQNSGVTIDDNNKLKINANDTGGQSNVFQALSTSASENRTTWIGRSLMGSKTLTFLMGTYNNMAAVGAHSWTDANAGSGAAWAPMYFQPDGGATAAIYMGQNGTGWKANTGTLIVKGSGTANAGTVDVNGTLTATTIKKTNGADTHVLLAGGGTKAISDFATANGYVTLDTAQTISGKKTFSGGLAITSAPENTNMIYFLGIDAFASGGTVKWTSKSDIKLPYSQITGTPTIPTVYNGKLTIQRNGTTIDTFTANQEEDVTVNIIDTLNTAGSTNDEAKLYLVGAKSQAASAQTYSDAQVYTQAGELNATSICVAEHGQIRYDATNECIRFVIA